MRFGRTLTLLLALILFLTGALVLTHMLRPEAPLLKGDKLFPINPESVIEISWDVAFTSGERVPMTLRRDGEFWRMQCPYVDALCDTAAVTQLLDASQALRVQTRLVQEDPETFVADRTLTLRTADATYSCAFGPPSPMELSQTLVRTGNEIVSVNSDAANALPQSVDAIRTHALLPFAPERIHTIEWRTPGRPFARALQMSNGNWNVTRPFAFEAKAQDVKPALSLLTSPDVIASYVLPSEPTTAGTNIVPAPRLTSEVELARYGLDEEHAIRVSLYLRGFTDAWTLRLGSPDPKQPENIYCLLDGYQAIVSAPTAVRTLFENSGPFATDFRDLPIFADFADRIQTITLRRATPDITIRLTQTRGVWQLLAPMNLPADNAHVRTLLSELTGLTGDLIGVEEPEAYPITCELSLLPAGDNATTTYVNLYQVSATDYYVYRSDQSRLYRVHFSQLPSELLADDLDRTLVDRTVFSLPAATIQRISAAHRDGTVETVARSTVSEAPWMTEVPRGSYVYRETIDAWLTCFAELKAERVLKNLPAGQEALKPYGLDRPFLTLTLDLQGNEDTLRRILLIGTPDEKTGTAPAIIQGRPILYEIDGKTLKLLQRPLVKEAE